MPYYKTLQKTTSNLLGNKLAKKYKIQKDFVIHKTKQQIQVITNDEVAYLIYDKYIIPTINYAIKNNLVEKKVYLDDKATKPILGGADVMAPGIFKFIDKCDDFNEDDVVFIEIENEIVGVGIAMVDKKSITSETKGVAVEVWQRMGDWSKNFAA